MSVVQSIMEHVGIKESPPTYECNDCGHEFESHSDPDSVWLKCSECDSEDVEQADAS
jgi:predicted Zn-ribbon and HTH transcriptional regulator